MPEAQDPQVQIKADEKELVAHYSNLVMIHHNRKSSHCISLRFSQCDTREAGVERDRQSGARQTAVAGAGENIARFEAQFAHSRSSSAGAAIEHRLRAVKHVQ